jgi:hypothetical protein
MDKLLSKPRNLYIELGVMTQEEYDKVITMLLSKDDEMCDLAVVILRDAREKTWNLTQEKLKFK